MTPDKFFESSHGYRFPTELRDKPIFTYENLMDFAKLYFDNQNPNDRLFNEAVESEGWTGRRLI